MENQATIWEMFLCMCSLDDWFLQNSGYEIEVLICVSCKVKCTWLSDIGLHL